MTQLNSIYIPPTKASSDQEWLKWYDEISGFGSKKAASAFTKAWAVRGSSKANTNDLRTGMKKHGINIPADGFFGTVEDTALSGFSTFTDFFKMGAIGTAVIGAIIFFVVIIIIYKNLSNPQTVQAIAGAAAKGATGGMA
jgi:hypothetical protein